MTETDVLIVGAGPTGLTLACELSRAGATSMIIDAAPTPSSGSRGKGLQPRTLEAFDDLGIAEDILAHGRMGMPIERFDEEGRGHLTVPLRPSRRRCHSLRR
jgi:2-polyprenyl-6-methoxyphenol hydroxylase-like FAD-dependent oxidoreductase